MSRASSIAIAGRQLIATADPFRRYRAFMAVLSKRYADRWQAQISLRYAKATGNVDNTSSAQVSTRQFETPNLALVNAEGAGELSRRPTSSRCWEAIRSRRLKPRSTRILPRTSGLPYARVQQFQQRPQYLGLSSTYRRFNIAPRGAYYLDRLNQLDVRFEKNFNFAVEPDRHLRGRRRTSTNVGTVTRHGSRDRQSVTLVDGSTFPLPFDTPATVQDPRQIRIGARWSF